MLKRLHPIAGIVGFITILAFWLSTVVSELSGSADMITAVKQAIARGFLILAPALAATEASGFRLAGGSSEPRIARKKRRMRFIPGNGVLILIPAVLCLGKLASLGELDALFYASKPSSLSPARSISR